MLDRARVSPGAPHERRNMNTSIKLDSLPETNTDDVLPPKTSNSKKTPTSPQSAKKTVVHQGVRSHLQKSIKKRCQPTSAE